MHQSELLEVVRTLSDKEWEELVGWVPSGYKHMHGLLKLITPHRPALESIQLEKKHIYHKLFPRRPYDDQRMREVMSNLYIHVRMYVTGKELFEESNMQTVMQLTALRKRGALRAYKKILKRAQLQADEAKIKDERAYLQQVMLAQEAEQFFAMQTDRTADMGIQRKMDSLDHYYLLNKLKLYCEQLNRMHILKADYRPDLLEEVMKMIEHKPSVLKQPQIQVYYRVLAILLHPTNEQYYGDLMRALPEYEKHFSPEEARNVYRYAQNYCIRKINQGKAEYYTSLLDTYMRLLNNRLILDKGKIDHTDYKNIVTTALRIKEYDWTLEFIEEYREKLPVEVEEGAYLYNKANYYYETGQPGKASDLLVNREFDDIFYGLSARHLLLKVFYDEEEFEALTYQVESFRVYLMRNKTISAANKESNLNFLKVMRRLASAKQQCDYMPGAELTKRIAGVKAAINKYEPLANKNWLTTQVEKLEVIADNK